MGYQSKKPKNLKISLGRDAPDYYTNKVRDEGWSSKWDWMQTSFDWPDWYKPFDSGHSYIDLPVSVENPGQRDFADRQRVFPTLGKYFKEPKRVERTRRVYHLSDEDRQAEGFNRPPTAHYVDWYKQLYKK